MFMTANIKPLVDGTIRSMLLNKPQLCLLERSVCVTGSVKGTGTGGGQHCPLIKEATDEHQVLFRRSSMAVWVRGPECWFSGPQLGSNLTDFHKCEWAEQPRALASARSEQCELVHQPISCHS